tara:strand:+ start:97 stop:294 length:198 start_codon:yes stop_codon:yes gene_type:complete
MTQDKIEQRIAELQKEKDYYVDLAEKSQKTLEQAKTLAFSRQEQLNILKEFLLKKEGKTEEKTDA